MAFLDDVKTVVVSASVATSSVFLSSGSNVPDGEGPYVTVIETGGLAPMLTHSSGHYTRPRAQIVVRAGDYGTARAVAGDIYDSCMEVKNEELNGTWYLKLRPLQEPFDLGVDESGRARSAINVEAILKPS